MPRRFAVILTLLGMLLPSFALAKEPPTKISGAFSYERSDDEYAAAIIIDTASGKVLYEYQADRPWSAASLTKLMGALVFMEHRPSWGRVLAITKDDQVGGGSLRVSPGATLSALDLLYSSITASANNAAVALARASGMSVKGFVKAMNVKARDMGLKNSVFVDPSGLNPKNKVTARDVAKLASAAFRVDMIRRAATTGTYRFRIRNANITKSIKNTNDLLIAREHDDVYVTGGKTGFLYESRYNLVVRMRPMADKSRSREVMVVVLGSPEREASFKTAKGLANWAWKAYKW